MKRKLLALFLALVMVISVITYLGPAAEAAAGNPRGGDAKPGAIIYVNADATGSENGKNWNNAFTDLQDALAAAVSGNEIWVAAGTYKPTSTNDRSVSFVLKSGVKVYGGFAGGENNLHQRSLDPGMTILSGDIGIPGDDTDNSYHVVYAKDVAGAVLDGFTVTLGRGDDAGKGAGMYNYNSALTVANCIFSHNKVAVGTNDIGPVFGRGAGMYNYNSAPIVTNCTFIENQAGNTAFKKRGGGGGIYNEGSFGSGPDAQWPVITGCTFISNIAMSQWSSGYQEGGGGILNYNCDPTIDRCIFKGNLAGTGGGISNYSGQPTITNCIFDTNGSSYGSGVGGAISNFGTIYAMILNCTFYQNGWRLLTSGEPNFRPYTYMGGAIYNGRGAIGTSIINSIFTKNGASYKGGAIYCESISDLRAPMLINSLFYENINWQSSYDPNKEVIDHGPTNTHRDSINNLYDIDPLLADPAGGHFRLQDNSPCIDSGTPEVYYYITGLIMPATDFEGNKRIIDGNGDGEPVVDIGAYEYVPTTYSVSVSVSPLKGGSVSGGGTYSAGDSVTVTAAANEGYTFVNWTEDGVEVTTDAAYTFDIDADRNLVANFQAESKDKPDKPDKPVKPGKP